MDSRCQYLRLKLIELITRAYFQFTFHVISFTLRLRLKHLKYLTKQNNMVNKTKTAEENYATQEREKAVNEFKQRLIKAITSEVNFDDGYDSILSVQNIIEKLK